MNNNKNQENVPDFWFTERDPQGFGISVKIKEKLLEKQTKYQFLEIFDTCNLGRMMVLDHLIMLSERDETHYHEMMVHVPMLCHPDPKTALVIGGGDGGCLRELLKYPALERAVQVEIDEDVVSASKKFFPHLAAYYDDPKVDLIIDDAVNYVKLSKEEFDVIIVDSTDPVGPAVGLLTESFYICLDRLLNDTGILVSQVGSPFYNLDHVTSVINKLRTVIPNTKLYLTHVPLYPSGLWGISFSAKGNCFWNNPDNVRYNTIADTLSYYNLETHVSSFALPQYARKMIKD